jgi:hypothetical protein
VHPHGIDIGPIKQGFVGGRIIAANPFNEFVLPQPI